MVQAANDPSCTAQHVFFRLGMDWTRSIWSSGSCSPKKNVAITIQFVMITQVKTISYTNQDLVQLSASNTTYVELIVQRGISNYDWCSGRLRVAYEELVEFINKITMQHPGGQFFIEYHVTCE